MSDKFIPNIPNVTMPGALTPETINIRYQAVVEAFDRLPDPAVSGKGFREPLKVGEPVDASDAVSKYWAETAMTSSVQQAHESSTQALAAQDAAKASEIAASTSASNAEAARDAAIFARNETEVFKDIAEFAKTDAETAIGTVIEYRDQAEVFRNNALTSAGNASTSEANALSYRNDAQGFSQAASDSAASANTSSTNAINAASSASSSATNASNSATVAFNSKEAAEQSKTAAEQARNAAEHSALLSANSASTAATSASSASASASNASASASNASASASNASASASNASASAEAASTSASNASTSETSAANSAAAAEGYRTEAQMSRSIAETAAQSAALSAVDATAIAVQDITPRFDLTVRTLVQPTIQSHLSRNKHKRYEQYGLEPKTITDIWEVNRNSTATYFDANGILRTAAPHEPRIHFDPSTGENLGLLVEGESTNLVLWSEGFGNSYWVKSSLSSSSFFTTAELAPDSISESWIMISTSQAGKNQLVFSSPISFLSGEYYTVSFFVKADGYGIVQLVLPAALFGTDVYANFNLYTGDLGFVSSNAQASIREMVNGWYRVSVTGLCLSSGVGAVGLAIRDIDSNARLPVWVADGTSGIYIWGAQLELGTKPTSYIPTQASTVTRLREIVTLKGAE